VLAQQILASRAQQPPHEFKLLEREPLPTSYGEDSYLRMFGTTEAISTSVVDTRR
jgi:hypothetical protein